MFKFISSVSKFVIGELFYTVCSLCDERTDQNIICGKCCKFQEVEPPLCLRCGGTLPMQMRECLSCSGTKSPMDRIRSHFWLDEDSKKLLHLAKYHDGAMYWNAFHRDAFQLEEVIEEGTVIIPVPLSFHRFWKRSYNQTWILGDWIAKQSGVSMICDGLLKSDDTKAQAQLSKEQRARNLKGAFKWNRRHVVPKKALLVDDVMTTGATLRECAKTLKQVGVQEVRAWTLFRTPLVRKI